MHSCTQLHSAACVMGPELQHKCISGAAVHSNTEPIRQRLYTREKAHSHTICSVWTRVTAVGQQHGTVHVSGQKDSMLHCAIMEVLNTALLLSTATFCP